MDKLSLADLHGLPIQVASPDEWTLGTFYQNNGLQPSRYKLYVVLQVGYLCTWPVETLIGNGPSFPLKRLESGTCPTSCLPLIV